MSDIKNYFSKSDKNVFSSLLSVYGIGKSRAFFICKSLKIPLSKKNKTLKNYEVKKIFNKLSIFEIEDNLKKKIKNDIKKLIYLKCYRSIKHVKKSHTRGKSIKSNSKNMQSFKKGVNFKKNLNVKKFKKRKK